MYKTEKKTNEFLMSWSVADNAQRLFARGGAAAAALQPLNGIKALLLMLIVLEHTVFAFHLTYIYNPEFLEKLSTAALGELHYNSIVGVQAFVVLGNFLLAHTQLHHANDIKRYGIFPSFCCLIFHRIVRIAPLYLFVIWWSATWWGSVGDGPLWAPLVQAQVTRCARTWWAYLLYINNFVTPHDRCLLQTWFITVDMQLYAVAGLLTLFLIRRPRAALAILPCLFLVSIIVNFIIAYKWNLKSLSLLVNFEWLREQHEGNPSFAWMYAAPWGNLPAALLGLLLAFLYHHTQLLGFKLEQYPWIARASQASVLLLPVSICTSGLFRDTRSLPLVALFTALNRPTFATLITISTFGFLYRISELQWRFLSWHVWEVLSRLSLSIVMVHWSFILTYLGLKPQVVYLSILEICSAVALVMIVTLALSLLLYLMLEAPAQRCLRPLTRPAPRSKRE